MGAKESKPTENGDVPVQTMTKLAKKFKKKKDKHDAKKTEWLLNKPLSEIVQEGNVAFVRTKISMLKDQITQDIKNENSTATGKSKISDVNAETEKRLKSLVCEVDSEGFSALHYAARDEYPEIAKELLAVGADPNLPNKKGVTSLHAAAKSVHDGSVNVEDVITILLNAGANVNAQDFNGTTPFHLAAYRDNIVAMQKLLSAENMDIHLKNKQGQNVLHLAAQTDANKVIEALKTSKGLDIADIRAKDKNGQTALHISCKYGGKESFSSILEIFKDGELDCKEVLIMKDREGNTPFHLAAASGDSETFDNFIYYYELETGTGEQEKDEEEEDDSWDEDDDLWDLNWLEDEMEKKDLVTIKDLCRVKNYNGETPLHLAAMAGDRYNVETILDKIAPGDIDIEDKKERTPLFGAVVYSCLEVVEILVDKGADIKHNDDNRNSPILIAADVSNYSVIETLLRRDPLGYEMRYDTNNDEKNPIHIAACRDDADVIKVLLKYCQDTDDHWLLDTPDRNNNTPLHIAAERGKADCVEALIDFNAEVDLKNADLNTPTHLACKFGRLRVLEVLVKYDREVLKTGDEDGNTPLHIACAQGHENAVKFLLSSNADKHAKNTRLQTPLYVAARYGHTVICKHLLKAGSLPNPKSVKQIETNKKTRPKSAVETFTHQTVPNPLHVACREGHSDLVSLLLKYNADVKLQDADGNNCLNIAIMNGNRETATAIIKSDQWCEALRNESTELVPRKRKTTPFRQLIERMPDVAETVLNRCVSFEKEINPTTGKPYPKYKEGCPINLDFQFIEDEVAPWKTKVILSGKVRKRHPLKLMADLKRESLLSHPLIVNLLDKKWYRTVWLYVAVFFVYAIYLTFLTGYMLVNQAPFSFTDPADPKRDFSEENCETLRNYWTVSFGGEADDFSSDMSRQVFVEIGQYVVLVLACISLLGEIIQFLYRGRKYLKELENLIDVMAYVCAVLLTVNFSSCAQETAIRSPWQWQVGAVSMFLSWVNVVLFYKIFPKLGMYVYMFSSITKTFLRVIRVFFIFIIAFGLTFFVLLRNQFEFKNVWSSIVKSSIMSTGEFEFGNVFHGHEEDPGSPEHNVPYGLMSEILILIFAAMMPILLMNLLVGLAVGDIQGLQANANLQRLRIQVDQTLDAEYYWLITVLRHRLQKSLQSIQVAKNESEYDGLKEIAVLEYEEAQAASLESQQQVVQRRFEKHIANQNIKMNEVMVKLETQEKQNEVTQKMLRKVLRQLNAGKEILEALPFKITNKTGSEIKCVLDWGGVLKTSRSTIDNEEDYNTWEGSLEDAPHVLYVFYYDTKLTYHFQPGKKNDFVISTEEEDYLKLVDSNGEEETVQIVKFDENTSNKLAAPMQSHHEQDVVDDLDENENVDEDKQSEEAVQVEDDHE